MLPISAFAIAQSLRFDIPAQPMPTALKAFADQAKVQLLYRHDAVKGVTGNAVVGEFDTRDALQMLLKGSGLEVVYSKDSAATIRPMQTASKPTAAVSRASEYTRLAQAESASSQSSPAPVSATSTEDSARERNELEEIIVTGTNIRGVYPSSSPVQIYTAQDIANTGATTTEQFISKLPQNFGTRTHHMSRVVSTTTNTEGVNSIDLRGLGVSTTLVLMNGRRLALAANGGAADISVIPVSAIERVEVLTDGASAIYGSDAVGGVVNFVLREGFKGAETRLSYGAVTSGDMHQEGVTQTFGHSWSSGRGLFSIDAFSASPLDRLDRNYAAPAGPGMLTPEDKRYNVLATVTQDLGERFALNGDFVASRRDIENDAVVDSGGAAPQDSSSRSRTNQYFANVGLDIDLRDDLSAAILASYSNVETDSTLVQFFPTLGNFTFVEDRRTEYSGLDVTAKLDGTVVSLPAGAVRFSMGAGYMGEELNPLRGAAANSPDLGRTTAYGFGELFIPLIGEAQQVPLVRRLSLNVAARHTSYEETSNPRANLDFGSDTSPKIGVLWSPTSDLNVRGTYGESFRAPSLSDLNPVRIENRLITRAVAGVSSTLLSFQGPSPDLSPETATSYTLGFDYRPQARSGFALSATYFNIDYTDRIGVGFSGSAPATNPARYPDIIFRPRSAADIAEILTTTPNRLNTTGIGLSNPQAAAAALFALPNFWMQNGRTKNLSMSQLDGFDLSISDSFQMAWGRIAIGVDLTRVFEYENRASRAASVLTGIDQVLLPVSFRGRAFAGLHLSGLDTTLSVNYIDSYTNPSGIGGARDVASWTTVDWSLSYDFAQSGVTLNLSVQNLLDEAPPFVAASAVNEGLNENVGFDPANANPLGRFVVLGIAKRWGSRP